MTKRVEVLEGRLVFQMRPASVLSRVHVAQWATKLKAHLEGLAALLGDEKTADSVLFNLAVLLAYTEGVAVTSEDAALHQFLTWWAKNDTPSLEWVIEHCGTPDVILQAWGDAYDEGRVLFDNPIERKPFDTMTPDEVAEATDPKAPSSSGAGNGSKAKSPKPGVTSPASTNP